MHIDNSACGMQKYYGNHHKQNGPMPHSTQMAEFHKHRKMTLGRSKDQQRQINVIGKKEWSCYDTENINKEFKWVIKPSSALNLSI